MRTLEQAAKLYLELYKKLSREEKDNLADFEARKFFRFGKSWRRLSWDKTKTVVLNDDSEELVVI